MDLLDRLLGHDVWTTREIIARCHELEVSQLHEAVDAGHESLHKTLVHMIGNVRVWTDLMEGTAVARTGSSWDRFSLDELAKHHESASADFAAFAVRIRNEGRLDERWLDQLDDPPTAKSFGGAIAHVLTHNMHHRCDLLHMLHRLGLPDLPEGDLLSWESSLTQ